MVQSFKKGSIIASCILVLSLFASDAFTADKSYTNSIGMQFVLVPAGTFQRTDIQSKSNKNPTAHKVTISKNFYLGIHEVTQEQWKAVMGDNPSYSTGRTRPVERVSWDTVQIFIKKLNSIEGHNRYRLPTEAEWEYASLAGSSGPFCFGDDPQMIDIYAWYGKNSNSDTVPVGRKEPNSWGLYDMHGNVGEWIQDFYAPYPNSDVIDPQGPSSGKFKIIRGGNFESDLWHCRSAARLDTASVNNNDRTGFRLALSTEK